MDISDSINLLFEGVVPEKKAEVLDLWNSVENTRLTDSPYFLLQAAYETVQVSELALQNVWLTGYAAWSGVNAFSGTILLNRMSGNMFDPKMWVLDPSLQPWLAPLNRLYLAVDDINGVETIEDVQWPDDAPKPIQGAAPHNVSDKAAFDLVCMAGAFMFAHELRHLLLAKTDWSGDAIAEEFECDQWATDLLLEDASSFGTANGYDPNKVKAKRALGIMLIQVMTVLQTKRCDWNGTRTHPPVRERLRRTLDRIPEYGVNSFWCGAVSILTGLAYKLDTLPEAIPFPGSDREWGWLSLILLQLNSRYKNRGFCDHKSKSQKSALPTLVKIRI